MSLFPAVLRADSNERRSEIEWFGWPLAKDRWRMSMKGLSHLPGILFLWLPFSCIACVSPSVRWSAIQWNLKNSLQPSTQVPSNALALASRPHHELHSLMKTCPAPTEQDLLGRWQGVNKGYAAACLGIHQDVKFFEVRRGQTSGFNILVKQVTLKN